MSSTQPRPPLGRRSTSGHRVLVLISGSGTNFQALIDATVPPSSRTASAQATTHDDSNSELLPNAQIVGVISNRKAAFGLQRARLSADPPIPTEVFSLKAFRDQRRSASQGGGSTQTDEDESAVREAYDEALATRVRSYQPDLVVLAGFMHIVSPRFLATLGHTIKHPQGPVATTPDGERIPTPAPVPIINLHPALPGQFDGIQAIERAFAAFQEGKIDKTGVMVHQVIAEVDRGAPVVVEEIPLLGANGERLVGSVQELEDKIHAVEHRLIVRGARAVLAGQSI